MNHDKQNRSFWQNVKDRGYYIALTLCAVAIGVSGYMYYRSTNQNDNKPVSGTEPQSNVQVGNVPGNQSVEVIGTTPSGTEASNPSNPTTPSSPTQPSDAALKTAWPLEGDTVGAYAMEALAYNETTRDWRVHDGIDLSADVGAQVKAAADGTVYTVYEDDSMGITVVIQHDGDYVTTYSSLAKDVRVKAGDTVTCGQVIGTIGETALVETAVGPHLHFSVSCDRKSMDPAKFFDL